MTNEQIRNLTRECVARWAVIDDESWSHVPEGMEQDFLHHVLLTATTILKMTQMPWAPLRCGYHYNCGWLFSVTCDMPGVKHDFPPIWLWGEEDNGKIKWSYATPSNEWRWRNATENQIRAWLLTRLSERGMLGHRKEGVQARENPHIEE